MKIPNRFDKIGFQSNTIYTTPHNLISNVSDSRYIVSMINTFDTTQVAFRAMDGITDIKDKCSAHSTEGSRNWWQIKFNEGKVKIVQITFVWRPGYPTTDNVALIVSNFWLQGSDDGVTFNTEAEFDVNVNATTVNKISVKNSYQYWRIIDNTYLRRYLVIGQIQFKYIITEKIKPEQLEKVLIFHAPLQNYGDSTAITGQKLGNIGTLENAEIDGKKCVYFDQGCIYTENMGLVGNVSFTQSLWFNLKEKNASDNIILTMGNTSLYGTAHIKIQGFYDSYYTMRCGGWAMDYDSPTLFQYNTWYHLVQTYDNVNGIFKFYVNGVQVASSINYNLNLINYKIVIGAFPALDQKIDKSYISDVKIYNYCLSDAEIQKLYQEQ